MSVFRWSLSRRRFLAAGTIAASDLLLAGCCPRGMWIFKAGTLATPPGVPVNSPLTIDVHCHIFNGTDLQIRKFLGDVEYPTWWGKAAGEILQLVNWDLLPAPTGDEEKAKLEKLIQPCKAEGGVARVSKTVQQKLNQYREEGYKRAKQAILIAKQKDTATPAPRGALLTLDYRHTQEAKQQMYSSFAAPDYATFRIKHCWT